MLKHVKHFLDYAMSHHDAIDTYQSSHMIPDTSSDASYHQSTFIQKMTRFYENNGTVLTIAQFIKAVMSSAAAAAELGA